ncbi:hypothetical protein RSAG8_03570, partial [Rhizoctonia solani AG-8 WAC10335]
MSQNGRPRNPIHGFCIVQNHLKICSFLFVAAWCRQAGRYPTLTSLGRASEMVLVLNLLVVQVSLAPITTLAYKNHATVIAENHHPAKFIGPDSKPLILPPR